MLTHLAPDLRCILAPNPSMMTGPGTNTWLLGQGGVAVIDPGPAIPAHLDAILAALGPGECITHIFVTHNHLDHTALAPRLAAATGAPTYGFGRAGDGRSALMQSLAARGLADGGEGIDTTFSPDIRLTDGQVVETAHWQLRALHTPGHAATHLCFAHGRRLFSGDHVMGWSSSLISPPDGDMAAYMASLAKLGNQDWDAAYPGHGTPVENPNARISALAQHRLQRESALLAALTTQPLSITALTEAVYHDVPPNLHPAARRNVLAHVIDLLARGLVTCPDICAADPFVQRS
ncbi:MAG: MBL fold metallo-hydrolase [Paracoccaceae bacterium]